MLSQYRVAGYRIDLVVEDNIQRLAIECDGDAWHGTEQYDKDMYRQRILERCGWRFIRVKGSAFYANPAGTIAELVQSIKDYGITPLGSKVDDDVVRDWIEEISGNQCLEELGTPTVDSAEENVVRQAGTAGISERDEEPDEETQAAERSR